MKKTIVTIAMLAALSSFAASSSLALTTSQVKAIKKALAGVESAELPAKAAEIVSNANKSDRQAVAVVTVKTIVSKHKSVAPSVVAAIARIAPEVAPAIVKVATSVSSQSPEMIVSAAKSAAPAMAEQITAAAAPVSVAPPAQPATQVSAVQAPRTRGNAKGINAAVALSQSKQSISQQYGSPNPVDFQGKPNPTTTGASPRNPFTTRRSF